MSSSLLLLLLLLSLRGTGRTLYRYHAWVCGFRIWCDITRTIDNVSLWLSWQILGIVHLLFHLVTYFKSWEYHTCQPSVIRTESPSFWHGWKPPSRRRKSPSFDNHFEVKKNCVHIGLPLFGNQERKLMVIFAAFRYFASQLSTTAYPSQALHPRLVSRTFIPDLVITLWCRELQSRTFLRPMLHQRWRFLTSRIIWQWPDKIAWNNESGPYALCPLRGSEVGLASLQDSHRNRVGQFGQICPDAMASQ